MSALWLVKVQTSKKQLSILQQALSFRLCWVYVYVSYCYFFLYAGKWEHLGEPVGSVKLQGDKVYSSPLQWLLVPTKEEDLHKGWVNVSSTFMHSLRHCQKALKKKWPKSNWSCLTGNKNNPWQTSQPAAHQICASDLREELKCKENSCE